MGLCQQLGACPHDVGVRRTPVRECGPSTLFNPCSLPPRTGFLELRQFRWGVWLPHGRSAQPLLKALLQRTMVILMSAADMVLYWQREQSAAACLLAVTARRAVNVEDDCLLKEAQGVSGDAGVSAPPSARVIHVALGARSC